MTAQPDYTTLAGFFPAPGNPNKSTRIRMRMRRVIVWPCGTHWILEPPIRGQDWEAPQYRDGSQTGVDFMASTRRQLLAELHAEGCWSYTKTERVQ